MLAVDELVEQTPGIEAMRTASLAWRGESPASSAACLRLMAGAGPKSVRLPCLPLHEQLAAAFQRPRLNAPRHVEHAFVVGLLGVAGQRAAKRTLPPSSSQDGSHSDGHPQTHRGLLQRVFCLVCLGTGTHSERFWRAAGAHATIL